MVKSWLSDEEFIKVWRQYGSPRDMAKATGMSERSVYDRRNSIERRLKIVLPSESKQALKHDSQVVRVIETSRRDTTRVEITDGVILVGSDAHYSPGVIPVAHKALCNLMTDLGTEVKVVVLNGDILDGGTISRHGRIGWHKAPSVKQELEAVQERLGDIEKARPAGCQLLRTYGNHDMRFETRLSGMVPEYEGIGGFLLRDHLPHWGDSERIDVNEDTVIIHDWHGGIHSGWNDVLKGGANVVTGHTHELSAKAHKGFKKLHYGVKTGMLADYDQDEFHYKGGRPGFNWQSGFAVLTWRDGMLLHPEFCAVRDDGRAYFRGKLYGD